MYHPTIIARNRATVERSLAEALPYGLHDYAVGEVQEFVEGMRHLFDKHGQVTRPLSQAESTFITNERILTKLDYRYWAERYCVVNLAGQTLGPLYPLWESQEMILDKIAQIQFDRDQSGHPDGVVADILKARQMGASTLTESLVGHRITTHGDVNALLASDVPDNSNFLYDMFERVVDNLPWFLKPTITERVKNDEMVMGTGSRLMMGASKSTRGADATASGGGKKGQLGRGKTVSVVHLSEIATWTNPTQIDTSLSPGIPVSPFTLWLKESTGQGRGPRNWWYMDWQNAKSGRSRSVAIFIGWYAERGKYWLPYPTEWSPNPDTLTHARRIEETSPRWMGRVYHPSKEQLYWYETTRAEYASKDQLEDFLQEYPADDEEAFQMSGKSVFPILARERVRNQARPLTGMVEIRPNRELGVA